MLANLFGTISGNCSKIQHKVYFKCFDETITIINNYLNLPEFVWCGAVYSLQYIRLKLFDYSTQIGKRKNILSNQVI